MAAKIFSQITSSTLHMSELKVLLQELQTKSYKVIMAGLLKYFTQEIKPSYRPTNQLW